MSVINRILACIAIAAFLFACNNSSKEPQVESHEVASDSEATVTDREAQYDEPVNTTEIAKKPGMVYLDTAESIYNILCQDWVLNDDAESLAGMSENSQFDIAYRSLCFSTNGTFLKNPRNAFDYGTWIYDDAAKTISINNTVDRGRDLYKIARITARQLTLVNVGINSATNLTFIAPGLRYRDPRNEPYALENNRWRIRPIHKESDSAIRQRLKDNLHFFILFYKSALDKHDKVVSFWGLPSCFKWYGGGIYLKNKTELKDNWIACFYNEDQAMQAYALADKLLSQKYTWPKGESNWIKLNLAVLEMMYARIDQLK